MKAIEPFIKVDEHGLHYALSILIASAVLWVSEHELAGSKSAPKFWRMSDIRQ